MNQHFARDSVGDEVQRHRLHFAGKKGPLSETIMVVLIVPMILLFCTMLSLIYFQRQMTSDAANHVKSILLESVHAQEATLHAALEGYYGMLETLAGVLVANGDFTDENLLLHVRAIVKKSDFCSAAVVKSDGQGFFNTGDRIDMSQRRFLAENMRGRRVIQHVDESRYSKVPMILISVPLLRNGIPIGALGGCIYEKDLHKLLVSGASGRKGYSFICDRDGRFIIVNEREKMILAKGLIDMRPGVKRPNGLELLRGSVYGERSYEDFRADLVAGRGGVISYGIDGQKRYAVYTPLGVNDWFLFNVMPAGTIDAELTRITRSTVLVVSVVAALSILLLLFLVWREKLSREKLEAESEQLRLSEELYRIAVSHSGERALRYDLKNRRCYEAAASRQRDSAYENFPESLIQSGDIAPESLDDFRQFFKRIDGGESNIHCVIRQKNREGEFRWQKCTATLILSDAGQPVYAILSCEDVTELREKELAYEKSRQAFDALPWKDVLYYEANLTQDLCEVEAGELSLGVPVSKTSCAYSELEKALLEFVHPLDRKACADFIGRMRLLSAYYAGEFEKNMELRLVGGGTERWMRVTVQTVLYPYSSDVKLYLLFKDIDKEKRERLLLLERSQNDALTGVLNRHGFLERLDALLKSGPPEGMHALAMIDLDYFKLVNDSLGHIAGDALLVKVVHTLRSFLRSGDLLGRIGGDEFMMCLKNMPSREVVAERIKELSERMRIKVADELEITCSIGVALYPDDGATFEELYHNADKAVYGVKDKGRNSFALYSDGNTPAL